VLNFNINADVLHADNTQNNTLFRFQTTNRQVRSVHDWNATSEHEARGLNENDSTLVMNKTKFGFLFKRK
jgi:hypothetical protein